MHPPEVVDGRLVFHLDDPHQLLRQVQLACDDDVVVATRFRRTADGWVLSVQPPDLDRLEYRLLVTDATGATSVILDPSNHVEVATAFGHRSVVHMPDYVEPAWLAASRVATNQTSKSVSTAVGTVPMSMWAPAPLDRATPAPLLVVHDGPEYVELAALGRWAAAMVATKRLRPFRMALLQPVERDDWYAVNPDWPAAVAEIVAAVAADWVVDEPLVLMGASLGGLAALQIALATPSVAGHQVGGVFAQSGSFFQPLLDPQESDYPHFGRITDWTTAVISDDDAPGGAHSELRIAMTCGRHEENHPNNVAMAAGLRQRGHEVTLETVEDLHNYTAWRDALDPPLPALLASVWQDGDPDGTVGTTPD
ncbi:MAG TPA: alpha/beta hydrolase-fold protein [Nitriliruptoraceae bacterium]|nr:alpha/beta hydrolase-fold protein [Nitriliruptoraceae bacterium]